MQVIDDAPIGLRLGVVELVNDDDVEGIGRDVVDAISVKRLNARKDVLPPFRPGTTDVQLAEVRIGEHLPVGPQRLRPGSPCDARQTARSAVRLPAAQTWLGSREPP